MASCNKSVGFGVACSLRSSARSLEAVSPLATVARGYLNDRYDWALLWGLVGALLLGAGLAAMIGTWWHLTRIHDDY